MQTYDQWVATHTPDVPAVPIAEPSKAGSAHYWENLVVSLASTAKPGYEGFVHYLMWRLHPKKRPWPNRIFLDFNMAYLYLLQIAERRDKRTADVLARWNARKQMKP